MRRPRTGLKRLKARAITAALRSAGYTEPGPPRLDAPCGFIDAPADGSEVAEGYVQIVGWCLFPGTTVTRLEVAVGSAPPQPARLALPRADIPKFTDHPSASLSGFEFMADTHNRADAAGRLSITATAYARDGRRLELAPVKLKVRSTEPAGDDARGAELRARARRQVRPRRAGADEGVRMLVFTHELTYSGGSLYLVELLRRLAAKPRFECAVVSLRDGPLRDDLEALRMPVHVTDPLPVTSPARYEGNQAELLGWAAPQGFNVAFVNTLGSFSGADLARRLGLPIVWAVHESFDFPLFWRAAYPDTLHPYVAARAERLLGEAAAVVFEAEATRKLFLPYAEGERLVTVPYGIELEPLFETRASYDRAEVRRALGLPQEARVLLCLGTMEPRKSQAMLAEAFARVAGRHPDAILVLVGEVNAPWCAYTRGVRSFIERSGLESRIRVEPIAADPLPWHAAADVHVCASDIESLPRSLLEAMAFGTPVVSTRVFGIPEVLEDGVTGYLCEPREPTDLARALDRVLAADRDELSRVTRAAAELVSIRHEPAGYAERMWNLLTALAAGSPVNAGEFLAADGMPADGNGTITRHAGASATGRAAPSAV